MKLSESIQEFLIPGTVLVGALILLIMNTEMGAKDIQRASSLGFVSIGVFLLALSYMLGILCSEIGTFIIKERGHRVVCKWISTRTEELSTTQWGITRDTKRKI